MFIRRFGPWLCCVAVMLSAEFSSTRRICGQVIPASATAVPTVASTDIRHLEIGDSYRVSVSRKGLTKQYDGKLVKANERWLVLLNVVEGRTERGVPVLSRRPM